MDTHPAISLLQQYSPLPAEGAYDADAYAEIGQALRQLRSCPPCEAIPALLRCADRHSDQTLLADAAIALAAFPADELDEHLQHIHSQRVPTAWLLAIFYQLPQYASVEQLERLQETEADDELRDRIEEEIRSLRSDGVLDGPDFAMKNFKRQNAIPRICEQADHAMRNRAFSEVVRILSPYQDLLPPVYQRKLQIAQRKSFSNPM